MRPSQNLSQKSSRLNDFLLLLLLSMTWGSSFALIKSAVGTIAPLTMVSARLIIASLTFLLIFWVMKKSFAQRTHDWYVYVIVAMCGNVLPFSLISWSEQSMDSGLAAILVGTMPLWTLLFTHIMTSDERFSARRLSGIVSGLLGVGLLHGDDIQLVRGEKMAMMAVILSAMSYGFAAATARRFKGDVMILASFATFIASLIMIPLALLADWQWLMTMPAIPNSAIIATIILGIVNTTLGGLLFFYLLMRAGALFASSSNYLMPPFGVLFGILFWNESPSWMALVALGFILAGCAALMPPSLGETSLNKTPIR